MKFVDIAVVAGTRKRDDGYLVADARIARTGVQSYLGIELDKPDMASVRVYRPGAEVFSADTMKSAAHRPVTNDHPSDMVNSENWKKHAVGQTGDEVTGEGIYLRVPLMVSDQATIDDIESGKRELSAGYTCTIDWTPGTTPSGEAYDAIQKDIRLNHVAIVARGRAGSSVRIGDAAATSWGAGPVTIQQEDHSMNLRTVLVDGLSVETTDSGAQAIGKLQNDLKASAASIATLQADHAKAIAAKDAEIAKKDAELDAAKAKILSDADLDKRVQARATLVTVAKGLAKDVALDGLSDADIRKAVVVKVLGDAVIAGKSAAYIDARFDTLVEDAAKGTDPVRAALLGGLSDGANAVVNDAYAKMVKDMQSGPIAAAAS